MIQNKYEVFLLQKDVYWFVSTGKQGDIYKAVLFQELPEHNRFNFAMGDIDMETGLIEFDKLSGNGDARKVLLRLVALLKNTRQFTRTMQYLYLVTLMIRGAVTV